MTPASVRGADAKKMLASLITRFTGSALVTFIHGLPTTGQYTTQFKFRVPRHFVDNVFSFNCLFINTLLNIIGSVYLYLQIFVIKTVYTYIFLKSNFPV